MRPARLTVDVTLMLPVLIIRQWGCVTVRETQQALPVTDVSRGFTGMLLMGPVPPVSAIFTGMSPVGSATVKRAIVFVDTILMAGPVIR